MSYMRVIVQSLDMTREAEANAFVDEVATAMAKAPGLQSWAAGYGAGTVVTSTLWDTREQAEAGLAAVMPDAPARIAAAGLKMVQVYVHEVLREVKPAAAPA